MTATWIPDAVSIAGIGATDFSKASGRSTLTLAAQATLAALEDAGLTPADVDGIVRCDMDAVSPVALGDIIGVENLTYWGDVGPGGAAPCAMIAQAVAAIQAGLATTVVVFRALNGRSGDRYGELPNLPSRAGGVDFDDLFAPFGMQTAGQYFGAVAQRHMIEHGTSPDSLGRIAVACRQHANKNPAAQMHRRPMTLEDHRASRMLSTPLRLFDYCLETDGACAVVVTSTERARDLRQPPVAVHSAAQASGAHAQPGQMFPALLRPTTTSWSSRTLSDILLNRVGLTVRDIDVSQVYDCFTITVLIQLEDFGFFEPGEAEDFLQDGVLGVDGVLPLNTAGGHLSEGYVHGMNHVIEGVRQVRGTSTNQVADVEVSLVTSAPPPGGSALLLTKGW